MPTPATSLKPLVIASPQVVGSALSIDTTVLPFTVTADSLALVWVSGAEVFPGTQITDSNGNVQTAQNHGFSGTVQPTWSTTQGGITADGTVNWVYLAVPSTTRLEVFTNQSQIFTFLSPVHGFTPSPLTSFSTFTGSISIDPTIPSTILQIRGRNYNPTGVWSAQHAFLVGDQIIDNNGNVQTVMTVTGPSGLTQPTFATLIGNKTVDSGVTWIMTGLPALTPTVKITLLFFQTNNAVIIGPPSGITAYRRQNNCQLEWATPTFPGFIGVRVMLSTDPTGVSVPFTQFGSAVVNNITRTANVIVGQSTTTAATTNQTVITTTQTTLPVNFSSVTIAPSDVQNANIFYAMLSTVIQDPNTNAVFESQQNGPITCGFVNLHVVQPTDFLALQRKEDIAGRIISQITRLFPDLDLTPRSELRDLVVDPFSLELSNMSVREWFSRVSTSISAISQLDDADGDGFSDPFDSSPLKQQLSRAYGLSAADTQALVDRQFDILGEQAGVTRGGATASVVNLTFFSFVQPTTSVTFPIGIQVGTVADANTPALTFVTRASATIDPLSAQSFFNSQFGYFAVTVPAECTTTGSVGNVGAGTIRTVTSGAPNGWNVTNLQGADFGQDAQINSKFASLIQASLVAGKDSGTRSGYLKAAIQTPGIVAARVVAAGDLEMVRDWDPIRQKHVFGTVDIYTRGTSFSQQNTNAVFAYQNTGTFNTLSTYFTATLLSSNLLKFQIPNFTTLPFGIYAGLEMLVQSGTSSFFFGTANAQFNNTTGTFTLDPNEAAYQYVGSAVTKAKVPLLLNTVPATNRTALNALSGAQLGTSSFLLVARFQSPLQITPTFQPVLQAISVTGQTGQTGVVSNSLLRLIHTSDFLLAGGSNQAGDKVAVNSTSSLPTSKNLTMTTNLVTIDNAMSVTVDSNGNPGDVLSVRSSDLSILYKFGTDYAIVPAGRYRTYALKLLTTQFNITQVATNPTGTVLTVTVNNNFVPGASVKFSGVTTATWLNGLTVTVATATPSQFTAVVSSVPLNYGPTSDTGLVVGQNIAPNQVVVVAYNQFVLRERLTFVPNESVTLNGTVATQLAQLGFVQNTWLPESYNNTTLTLDGWDGLFGSDGGLDIAGSTGLVGASVPHDSRYIKVTFNGNVMKEGIDYTLTVDPVSGVATLARILTGHIGNGSTVLVSYFVTEEFTIATQYPAFVAQLATTINATKHAAADVLIKAMVANGVDVSLTVELDKTAAPEVMDPKIRTIISIVMDLASTNPAALASTSASTPTAKLTQAELIRQVKAITGVSNVKVPLTKFAKSDGSYDIDTIVPTGTSWLALAQDPAFTNTPNPSNSFITQFSVLPDATIPSGGLADAFVGMLFEGQSFRRALSIQDFFTSTVPSFYIIGTNDQINSTTPLSNSYAQRILLKEDPTVNSPALRPYRVTYQVFGEGGTKDITISSTEFFVPGRITINFVTGS